MPKLAATGRATSFPEALAAYARLAIASGSTRRGGRVRDGDAAGRATCFVPGDAARSLLWRKVAAVDLCGNRMPNGRTPLPSADIEALADWINAGAADD